MSFPRYPKYKASGVEWLGDVPEHWDVRSFRHCLSELFNGLTSTQVDETEVTVPVTRIETISTGTIDESRLGFINAEDARDDRKLRDGDILFSNINSLNMIGNCAIYKGGREIYAGMNLLVLRPASQSEPRWLYWLVRSPVFREVVESLAKPAINQASISQSSINSIAVPVPVESEQTLIASFLDRETSKIDGLVGEQRRLIELLKEKRQAVISHAVTKGLNPHAPLKPSGIEWLGDVPEHWEMARVKFASHRISKGDTPSNFGMEFAVDGPVRFIKIENIGEGELIEVPTYSIDFDAHDQLTRSQLQADDIVFAIAGATTGKCAIIRPEHLPANTNQAVAYIRPNHRVNPPFLVTWLQNRRLQEAMWEMTSQSAQPNLSMENLGNLPIPIPPKDEQREIVRHVTKIGGGYLQLMAEAERGIELLQERRTALISAAVTGQIDVRGLVETGEAA